MLSLGRTIWCVAGTGNAPPTESDVLLDAYAGRANTAINSVLDINNDAGNLPLYWRVTLRSTFEPGAFGGSSVNIAEAGMAQTSTDAPSSITSTSPLSSRGLLVDSFGNPTTVSVAPSEYLDIIWEYTEYLPYDLAGAVSLVLIS